MWNNRQNQYQQNHDRNPFRDFYPNNLPNNAGGARIINPMILAGYAPHQQPQRPNVWESENSAQTLGFQQYFPDQDRRVSLDNERLLATVTNHHQHHQELPQHHQDLPDKLYDNTCAIVHVNDFLECGVLELVGSRGQTAKCLFLRKDVLVQGRRERLSDEVPRGGCYRANAWLVNPFSEIPYLAANVWFDGVENIPPVIMRRIWSSVDEESLNVYNRVATDLLSDVPGPSATQRNVVLVDQDRQEEGRDLGRKIVFRGDEGDSDDRPWSPMGQFREQLSSQRRVQVWEESQVLNSPQQLGTNRRVEIRSNNGARRSRSSSREGRSKSSQQKRSRKSRSKESRNRSRSKERRRVREISPRLDLSKNKFLDQLAFEDCTTARVSSYLGNGIGVLSVCRGAERRKEDRNRSLKEAYFHTDQVWTRTPGLGLHQSSEVYRSRDVESQLRVGSTVYCNVRRIQASQADCQALFVGKNPEDYRDWVKLVTNLEDTSTIELSIDQNLSLFSLHEKKKEASLELLPAESLPCEARVKEYFSLDYGLLELAEAGTVLFNLSHVYLPVQNCWKRLNSSQLLSDNFPVGTTVDVLLTRIPCHQHSDLKYQALAVFKKTNENIENPLTFFKSKFNTNEEKLELKKSLRRHFDTLKNYANLQAHPKNNLFSPVHVVLDSLPESWQAVVVAEISAEFGIIRISSKVPGNLTLKSGKSLKLLNVLFHIEDVFCEEGDKAVSRGLQIPSLLNRSVQLTARSICAEDSPDGIFMHVQELLSQDGSLLGIPVLQAVTVCLVPGSADKAPSPTFLRNQPPSFVSDLSYYFLGFGLKTSLDIKLVQFLAEPKKPPLPYKQHFTKSYDYKKEKSVVEDLKSIDTETSMKIIYGSLRVKNIDVSKQENLPQTISRIECKVVFLYRTNLKAERGVVQVKPLVDNSPVECLAYFQHSDVHKQLYSDSVCKDLVNLMPCKSQDKFSVSLQLQDPLSPIPYVATKIWNETVRIENNLPELNVALSIDAHGMKFRKSFIKSMIASCPNQPDVVQEEKPKEPPPTKEKEKENVKTEFATYVEKISSKTSQVGRVSKILNQNYGVAVCVSPSRNSIQVLFDVYDVWNREAKDGNFDVLANQKKKIGDVMAVGDFLRLHMIEVKSSAKVVKRPISHMATAVIAAKTFETLKDKEFPEGAVELESLDQVDETKVENFEKVVKLLENIEMDRKEKKVIADLLNMFGNTEVGPKDNEIPGKKTIKTEKLEKAVVKIEPKDSEEGENKKAVVEEVSKKKSELKSEEESQVPSKVEFDIKKELEVAVGEMVEAAAAVRECYRLTNSGH